jgi:hypothetical protein
MVLMNKLIIVFCLVLFSNFTQAGEMKKIYTVVNESIENYLGLDQESGVIRISLYDFVEPSLEQATLAISTEVYNNYLNVYYGCTVELEKTETYYRMLMTKCLKK